MDLEFDRLSEPMCKRPMTRETLLWHESPANTALRKSCQFKLITDST
jgi:hypothetical protein